VMADRGRVAASWRATIIINSEVAAAAISQSTVLISAWWGWIEQRAFAPPETHPMLQGGGETSKSDAGARHSG